MKKFTFILVLMAIFASFSFAQPITQSALARFVTALPNPNECVSGDKNQALLLVLNTDLYICRGNSYQKTSSSADLLTQTDVENIIRNLFADSAEVEFVFDAISNTLRANLKASGVTAGTYGSSSQIPVVQVDSKGRVISITNVTGSGGSGAGVSEYTSKTEFPATGVVGNLYIDKSNNKLYRWNSLKYILLSPSPLLESSADITYSVSLDLNTGEAIYTPNLANTGVTAGTYGSATENLVTQVDAKGRITSISSVASSSAGGGSVYETIANSPATFDAAVATANANPANRYSMLLTDAISISSNKIIPSNVILSVVNGGKFIRVGSSTLQILGAINVPPVQFLEGFSGGNIKLLGAIPEFYLEWYGGKGDWNGNPLTATDNTPAFEQALRSKAEEGGGSFAIHNGVKIKLLAGQYYIKDNPADFDNNAVTIRYASTIEGTNGANLSYASRIIVECGKTAFHVTRGGSENEIFSSTNTRFSNFRITSNGKCGSTGDGIRTNSEVHINNMYIDEMPRHGIFSSGFAQYTFTGNSNISSFQNIFSEFLGRGNAEPTASTLNVSVTAGSDLITSTDAEFNNDSFGTVVKISDAQLLNIQSVSVITSNKGINEVFVKTTTPHNLHGGVVTIAGTATSSYNTTVSIRPVSTTSFLLIKDTSNGVPVTPNGNLGAGGTVTAERIGEICEVISPTQARICEEFTTTDPETYMYPIKDAPFYIVSGTKGDTTLTVPSDTYKVGRAFAILDATTGFGIASGRITSVNSATEIGIFPALPQNIINRRLLIQRPPPIVFDQTVSGNKLYIAGYGLNLAGGNNQVNSIINHNGLNNNGGVIYGNVTYGENASNIHASGAGYHPISLTGGSHSHHVITNPYTESQSYPIRVIGTGSIILGGEKESGVSYDTTAVIQQEEEFKFGTKQLVSIGLRFYDKSPASLTVLAPKSAIAVNEQFEEIPNRLANIGIYAQGYGSGEQVEDGGIRSVFNNYSFDNSNLVKNISAISNTAFASGNTASFYSNNLGVGTKYAFFGENGMMRFGGATIQNTANSLTASSTPSIEGKTFYKVNYTVAMNITNFLGGIEGQELMLYFLNSNATIIHDTSKIRLKSGANFTSSGDILIKRFINISGVWIEI